ncbi:MAG: TonB-dependent receptor [Candidatus Eremiobacteraeota bacterium]|nr:TonB-dependent receptor [Candidatus Eremiobacteraeota bacterium]
MRTLYRAAAAVAFAYLSLTGTAGAASVPQTVAQTAPDQTVAISGKVADSRGAPLADATVLVEGGAKSYTTKSRNDGSFTLNLPPGVYTVTVNHGGFQTTQNDLAVVAGTSQTIGVTLQELNLSSLRVIGRTGVSFNRTPFNISESPVNVLPPLEITLRQNANLTDTVSVLPGVVATRTFSATPNTSFAVRGLDKQTRVTIDGHPISSGISGTWNTNYAVASIFGDVEVVKGAGLNGSIAGESAVGTVNLRTRDFTRKNSAGLSFGTDSYNGGQYNVFADVNFLTNDRASLIVQKAFHGVNGPWNNQTKDRVGASNSGSITKGTLQPPSIIGLDQWRGDFSNRYSLEGELVKLRYRLSGNTSVTLEYLGLQGQYQPQGGSYAAYQGNMTVQACQTAGVFQPTLATCGATSTYTAPYTFSNIGNTVDAYTWFPNSFIQNNEPTFAAEFRTSLKNDTFLFRPYTHLINRFISGDFENSYPGNGGGWFAVTSAANCQVRFSAPVAGTGAKGPCFPVTTGQNGPAYIGPDGTPHKFATTPNAPTCSPTPPYTCFTTSTGVQNDGVVAFGTPFSQPELDRLNGYTFSWIHPVGPHVFNVSYDYRKDFSQSQSGDQTAAAAGCGFVIGSGASAVTVPGTSLGPVGTLYQPSCTLPGFLPRSAINTPPTVAQYGDLAVTGSFELGPRLHVFLGNYFSNFKINAQIENPAVLALYASAGNAGAAPVALVTRTTNYSHYDPHLGFQFRATPSLSFRGNAGSSITQPWPALVSGFGSITIPNAANGGNYTNSIPNFNLKPETTVAYNLGFDNRMHDGGVLSMDFYNVTVHDVFLANTTLLAPITGICGPGQNAGFPNALCLQSNQINGPLQRSYGAELQLSKNPVNGWGYFLAGSAQRTFLDQLPRSIYFSNTTPANGNFNVNGAQIFGHPFFKSYAQLLYGDARGDVFALGVDYAAANNFSFGPPYTVWDASARFRVHPKARLLISAQNLFNLNTGTYLGRSLSNQGNFQPTVYLSGGQLLPSQSNANLNSLPPRTIRINLDVTP